MSDIATLIPAATVICLKDGDEGIEALLLRRNRDLKAFAGAWVFPGGRVDAADAPEEGELARARAAAIREAKEETGLDLADARLEVLSQWIPPVQEKRRFSTWFFVTSVGHETINIDGGEIHDFKWVKPQEVIGSTPHPETLILPPTYVSLHQLMDFKTTKAALDGIAQWPNDRFETKFDRVENGFVTYWEDDIAYHSGDLDRAGPRHRLIAAKAGWDYQRSG